MQEASLVTVIEMVEKQKLWLEVKDAGKRQMMESRTSEAHTLHDGHFGTGWAHGRFDDKLTKKRVGGAKGFKCCSQNFT